MGEVVPARTSPTLHPPSPPTVHQLSCTLRVRMSPHWCNAAGCSEQQVIYFQLRNYQFHHLPITVGKLSRVEAIFLVRSTLEIKP